MLKLVREVYLEYFQYCVGKPMSMVASLEAPVIERSFAHRTLQARVTLRAPAPGVVLPCMA